MDRPLRSQLDPRIQELSRLASQVFGPDKAAQLMEHLPPDPAQSPARPRDAGKFVRQLAALYCDNSPQGQRAQELVRMIITDALALVNLISQVNPEG